LKKKEIIFERARPENNFLPSRDFGTLPAGSNFSVLTEVHGSLQK